MGSTEKATETSTLHSVEVFNSTERERSFETTIKRDGEDVVERQFDIPANAFWLLDSGWDAKPGKYTVTIRDIGDKISVTKDAPGEPDHLKGVGGYNEDGNMRLEWVKITPDTSSQEEA